MNTNHDRLDYLDAVRAFALLLGIVFHASLSFVPFYFGWAVMDISTSSLISGFMLVSHAFRMELFFLIAGFFSAMTLRKKGVGAFLTMRLVRLGIPFVLGWFVLRPLLVSGWVMGAESLRGDVNILYGLSMGWQSLRQLPTGLFTGSHLWFLYYLMMITAILLCLRAVRHAPKLHRFTIEKWDASCTAVIESRFALLYLSVPTALCLLQMNTWGMDTPDQSLSPHFPVLFVYGVFFGLGWWFQERQALLDTFTRITRGRLILCIASICTSLALAGYQSESTHPHFVILKNAFVLAYALMMWSLVAVCIGLFRRFSNRPNAWVRYVADASYWLYLIHLPIVVWLQVAVAEWPLHWFFKLTLVSTSCVLISLLLYDLFVRDTPVGKLLNGRRKPAIMQRGNRRKKVLHR